MSEPSQPPIRHDHREGDAVTQHEPGRGRDARSPREIPWTGWKDILIRIKDELASDDVGLVAAGIAFYAFLSLLPALIAAISIYGLVSDPAEIREQAARLAGVLPASARDLVREQLATLAGTDRTTLGVGALIALLTTLWSASRSARALITGLNIAYDEEETRGFIAQNLLALGLTIGAIVLGAVALAFITVVPYLFDRLGFTSAGLVAIELIRWPVLLGGLLFGLAVLYRLAPDRTSARWQWLTAGTVTAALLWLAASMGFSWYTANFGNFNRLYGSLAGAIVLLLWFQISAFVALLGAEINAEIEHQTAVDSTVGEPKPMGQRGAVKADTLGKTRNSTGRSTPPAARE